MFEVVRTMSIASRKLGTLGLAALALGSAFQVAANPAQAPLVLGMAYVEPPHKPGAKVRTPEGLAPVLAERLAKSVPLKPTTVSKKDIVSGQGQAVSSADLHLLPLNAEEAAKVPGTVIPTGYRAGIMAIMRTDTDIRQWEDLRGRTVCLAEGSGLAGQIHAQYGAVEKVLRAPADALLDLRIGGCDAAVHDSTMLEALLQFPEWKKFSARLPVLDERELSFVVPHQAEQYAELLRRHIEEWQQQALLPKLTAQAARDIAFEVYMDQEVPDCH